MLIDYDFKTHLGSIGDKFNMILSVDRRIIDTHFIFRV